MPPKKNDKKSGKDHPFEELLTSEPTTTIDDIKTLLLSQEKKFQDNFKSQDVHIKTYISQLKEDLHKATDPLVEKQKLTDKKIVSLKEQLVKNSKGTQENRKLLEKVFETTQEQIKTTQNLSTTLLEIQVQQAQTTPDPRPSNKEEDFMKISREKIAYLRFKTALKP